MSLAGRGGTSRRMADHECADQQDDLARRLAVGFRRWRARFTDRL